MPEFDETISARIDRLAEGGNIILEDRSPEGHANPFVLLRIGELHMSHGNTDPAVSLLLRTYMLEGEEIFDDTPEALEFLGRHQSLS